MSDYSNNFKTVLTNCNLFLQLSSSFSLQSADTPALHFFRSSTMPRVNRIQLNAAINKVNFLFANNSVAQYETLSDAEKATFRLHYRSVVIDLLLEIDLLGNCFWSFILRQKVLDFQKDFNLFTNAPEANMGSTLLN